MKRARQPSDSDIETLLANAADEFTLALNRGESPEIEDYAKRYPQIADTIRRIFPAMAALDQSASSNHASSNSKFDARRPFDRLGEFKIIHELGRGGMGVVYKAEQESLGRIVALKVLPVSALLDDKQLARFKNEARAAATLSHPNIVPVYSVGVESGVHFYAMRLIDGQSMAEIIQKRCLGDVTASTGFDCDLDDSTRDSTGGSTLHHSPGRHDGSQAETLGQANDTDSTTFFRGVAVLGVQAAQALDHAHAHGILHRDIKPANLMIDRVGHLWVTDFGVARLESDAGMTVTGDLLGTIRYMSPEQAIGDRVIDQRTDVYSLGMTLYELLTLQPGFTGNDRLDLLQKIANQDPVSPRRIRSSIPLDLETIILKAIQKDAADRYATADEMAKDLQSYLDDRPIQARPPSIVERATKWSRRHQAVVGAGLGAMTLALIILAISTFMIGNAYKTADGQRERAETNLRLAREVIDNVYAKEIELLKDEPGMTPKQREFLTAIAKFYEQLPKQELEDEALLHKACQTRLSLGEILRVLGRDNEAIRNYRDAIVQAEGLLTRFPDRVHFRKSLAYGYDGLGQTLLGKQEFAQAIQAHEKAISLAGEVIAAYPNDVEFQRLATLRLNFALALQTTADRENSLRETIRSMETLRKKFPNETEFESCLARAVDHLGSLLATTGRNREAEEQYRYALEIQQRLATASPRIPGFRYQAAKTQSHLAVMLADQGRSRQAEQATREAIQTLGILAADYPHRFAYKIELARFQTKLGRLQFELEHFDEAKLAYTNAIETLQTLDVGDSQTIATKDSESDQPRENRMPKVRFELATNYGLLGDISFQRRQLPAAKDHYTKSHQIWSELAKQFPDDPETRFQIVASRAQMARVLSRSAGLQEYESAVCEIQKLSKQFPERVEYTDLAVRLLGGYANSLNAVGRTEEAEKQTMIGIDYANRFADRFPEESQFLWFGDLSVQLGDYAKAVSAHRTASESYRQLIEKCPDRPRYRADLATSLKRLGNAQIRVGNLHAAFESFSESISVAESLVQENPDVAAYHNKVERRYALLGNLLLRMGRLSDSAAAYRTSLATGMKIRESFPDYPQSAIELIQTRVRLANIYLEQNSPSLDDAKSELQDAMKICDSIHALTIKVSLLCQLASIDAELQVDAAKSTLLAADDLTRQLAKQVRDSPAKLRRVSLLRWDIAHGFQQIGEHEQASTIMESLMAQDDPEDAAWMQSQAWYMINHDHSADRIARALELVRAAVAIAPENATSFHTLGVALYRANDFEAAAESFRKSISLNRSPDPFNSLFLAMVESKLGRNEDARKYFRFANENLLFADPLRIMHYRRFRDEAAALMTANLVTEVATQDTDGK